MMTMRIGHRTISMLALVGLLNSDLSAEAETMSRNRERFCNAWQFNLGDVPGAEAPNFNDSAWRTLNLPHDWSIELPFDSRMPGGNSVGYLPGGIGWYRKAFTVPESDRGKKVVIDFDGVYMDSQVWINGHLLGRRPNGYISFHYDLTPHLKQGDEKNVIAVRANVEPNFSRWYPGAGIYRRVWLTKMNPVHVAHWGSFVTTPEVAADRATVRLQTEVENESDHASELKITSLIQDAQGNVVSTAEASHRLDAGGTYRFDQQFVVSHPNLWSPDSPDLYRIVSTLTVGSHVVDEVVTPFGIRTVKFTTDHGFFLNGEHVDIKGVCLHHDYGPIGTAFYPRALERQLEILRGMGCNAIRTAHNPRDPAFYSICDRMGFMVMDEAFDVWEQRKLPNDYSQFFGEWHERDLTAMVLRDRNHPSVIIWSIGNEMNEQHREDFPGQGGVIASRLVEIVKQHDPSRAITSGCNSYRASVAKGMVEPLDVYGQNYGMTQFPEIRKGGKPVIGTENATSFITRGSYSYEIVLDQGIKLAIQNIKNNSECTGYGKFWGDDRTDGTLIEMRKNPWVAGQFAWTGFDYIGECFPFTWPARNGLFGIIDMVGFPKDSYYAYQSDWTDEPMVHIIPQHWNWEQFQSKPLPVWVYSNCDNVELFLNGKSLGVKTIDRDQSLHAEWDVSCRAGEIKAVGFKDGKPVSTNIVRTAGAPARLELSADRSEIAADGADLSFVEVRLVDENGVLCPESDLMIKAKLEGEGALLGIGNGSAFNHEPFKGNRVKTFHGLCRVIVKSKKQPGTIQLNITADSIEGDTIAIKTLPTDSPQLSKAAAEKEARFREKNKHYSRHRLAVVRINGVLVGDMQEQPGLQEDAIATGKLTVAPVSKHGPGLHVDSVIVSRNRKPPTWTKAAARDVVLDELKRQGLEFTTQGEMPRIGGIPATRDGNAAEVDGNQAAPSVLTFDGVSRKGKIAFEVLTTEDVPTITDNTDHILNLLGAAQKLVAELETKPGGYTVGVFYDPMEGKGSVPNDEPLRMQVRDFVQWLGEQSE